MALTPEQVIARIAEVAENVGWHAGVGGCETAGAIISYLANHPEDTEKFLEGGIMELPADLWAQGKLTFHRKLDGKVTTPQDLRISKVVRDISRPAPNTQDRDK